MVVLNPSLRPDTSLKGFELIDLLRKEEQTAEIQRVMRHAYTFKEYPFLGEVLGPQLMSLRLLWDTVKGLFQRLRAWQVVGLERSSPQLFSRFSWKMMDDDQRLFVRFFQQAACMNEATIKKSFQILDHIIRKDPSLFDEMVRFLDRTFQRSPQIDAIALAAGLRLDPTFNRDCLARIKVIRPGGERKVISVEVQDVCRIDNISLVRLREYPYFSVQLDRWNRAPSEPLPLQVEEGVTKDDLEWLFLFIQTKTPIPVGKILTLLPLANSLGIEDCVKDCYQTMMKNREDFEKKLGIIGFLQFLFDHAHFTGSHEVHKEKAELRKLYERYVESDQIELLRDLVEIAPREVSSLIRGDFYASQ